MAKTLKTNHGTLTLPTFFPDGTLGVVRGVDSKDLEEVRVEGLVINTYHLVVMGMEKKIKPFGNIHKLMNWKKPIVTDSGGFQVMSLVHDYPAMGKITDQGVTFRTLDGTKINLTPEKSIQVQLSLGTDIAIVLDDCTRPETGLEEQKKSVERTIAWAKRSKDEFGKLISFTRPGLAKSLQQGQALRRLTRLTSSSTDLLRPLLFAVVQGGNNKKLRKYCARELLKIGFDGYCFGGFPVQDGKFLSRIVAYTAKLLPDDKPKYALGVGKPENIVECFKMGYQIFDCVIPTREARHKKLYIFNSSAGVNLIHPKGGSTKHLLSIPQQNVKSFYSTINIGSSKYAQDKNPVSKFCNCFTCQNYSKAYLHHLFKIGDTLAIRLATIHNLRFYAMLMEALKN